MKYMLFVYSFACLFLLNNNINAQVRQTYSTNMVGYVNQVIYHDGYNLICNPFNNPVSNRIRDVLPSMPDGTMLVRWNNVTQTFFPSDIYFAFEPPDNIYDGWYNDNCELSTSVINPATGFFLQSSTNRNFTVTISGEVKQGTFTNVIRPGYNLLAFNTPKNLLLNDSASEFYGFPIAGDLIFKLNPITQIYDPAIEYVELDNLGWYPNEADSIPVGIGFFYYSNATTNRLWIYHYEGSL